jgi:hypothetical protein
VDNSSRKTIANTLIGAAVVAAVAVAVTAIILSDPTGKKGSGLGSRLQLDLTGLRKIEPRLISHTQTVTFETGFKRSLGIAVGPGGLIYVAGDQAIRVFDEAGKLLREMGLPGQPRCLAVAADESMYVGLGDHVEVFNADGTRRAAWDAPGEKTVITCIALGGDGSDVFVADYGGRQVLRYSRTGTLLNRIVPKGRDGTFNIPSPYFDVALTAEGLFRVANTGHHRIETYTSAGEFRSAWGKQSELVGGFIGCCNPAHIASFPDGRVLTSEKHLPTIKIYSPDGRLESVVASPQMLTPRPEECANFFRDEGLDVAIDPAGRVLVLDPAGTVRILTRKKDN